MDNNRVLDDATLAKFEATAKRLTTRLKAKGFDGEVIFDGETHQGGASSICFPARRLAPTALSAARSRSAE